jgi:hypothetical protein
MKDYPKVLSYKEFADKFGDYEGFNAIMEMPIGDDETVEIRVEDDGRSGDYMVTSNDPAWKTAQVQEAWTELVDEAATTSVFDYVEKVLEASGF